ncbi:unnamed protein product, partial [Durusdinium trenchii]
MLWKEQEVWAHVASEFDSLKTKTPPGQSDGAIGQAFSLEKVVNALQVGERELRNVACNICWTVPLFESIDGDTLSLQLIEKFAKARFYADGKPKAPRLWPSIVIPIALMQKDDLPPKTTWKRYGGDIAVAAFWYAFAMAKKDGLPGPDLEAFRSLARTSGALNVPFTFKYFATEGERFACATALCENFEELREYFGLDCARLVQVVLNAKKQVEEEKRNVTDKVTKEHISAWLREKIRWADPKRCPKPDTCGQLLQIGEWLSRSHRARSAMQLARVVCGRTTCFDEYSKVLLMTQRSMNTEDFDFAVEFLTMKLFRSQAPENPSLSELRSKAGELSFGLFARKYATELWASCSGACSTNVPPQILKRAKGVLMSPLTFHDEFPLQAVKDLSWVAALPKPLSMAVNHMKQVLSGEYNSDIKGLLSSPPAGGATADHAKGLENVKKQFWVPFDLALKELEPERADTQATDHQVSEEAGGESVQADCKDTLAKFKADSDVRAKEFLSQHLVTVVQSAPAAAALTELLRNSLVDSTERRMGFFDPKNCSVPKIYATQSKWQRVPLIDEEEFQQFCKAIDGLLLNLIGLGLTPGRDVVWVMGGKVRSNEDTINKVTRALKWSKKEFMLNYDAKMMQEMGYFTRMRGLGNAGTAEKLFLFFKGQAPRDFKKTRLFVDAGSRTYIDSILKVPIATARELALVSRTCWEAFSKNEKSECVVEAFDVEAESGSDDEHGEPADTTVKKRKYPKRGTALTRQPSSDEVLLFAHDNSALLMKELAHECGARWCIHASPELGLPTIAIVKTELHKTELEKALRSRLAQDLPISGSALGNAELARRALALGLTKPAPLRKRKGQEADLADGASSEPEPPQYETPPKSKKTDKENKDKTEKKKDSKKHKKDKKEKDK